MKNEFWILKWQENQIGFHKDSVHRMLTQHVDELSLVNSNTVFVPLCGKTIDMLWLHQQGYKVIGIELSQIAVEEFFNENKLDYTQTKTTDFNIYKHKEITIYQGDFFKLTKKDLKDVKATYDRAALIALSDELQKSYVKHLNAITPKQTPTLLITLEFNHPSGPPFSTPLPKVENLYPNTTIMSLQSEDIIEEMPMHKNKDCEEVIERVYLMK